jgi:predicted metal-binding membrane protein
VVSCRTLGVSAEVLARDRTTLVTGSVLLVTAGLAWGALVAQPDMLMANTGLPAALIFLAAWGVMMAAMMLPSATPMIALYGAIRRKVPDNASAGIPTAVFALVYLALWVMFGVPIYVASVVIDSQGDIMDLLPAATALVLVAAGVYQFTPLKRACLRVCRNPLSFLWARSRSGYRGTLMLAVEHAAYCIGCCWALMIVLVAAGAMALAWALLIAVVVFLEKLIPRGEVSARVTGIALIGLGLAVVMHPDLVQMLHPNNMGM